MRALSVLTTAVLLAIISTAQADSGSTEPRRATVEQIEQVTGAYKLSDGRRAEIYALGTRLYVKVGRGQQKELLLAGPSRFESLDGKMSIQFGPEFDTNRIVLERDRGLQNRIHLASNERGGRGSAD